MCGLVGTFGNLLKGDVDYFKQALVCDYFRGKHSTGVMTVADNNTNNLFTFKKATDPITFQQFSEVNNNLTVSKKLLAGHNRHATLGGVNSVNAHPFTHGDITLMHNGTLTNLAELRRKFDAPTFDTDSETICWLIDNYDLVQVLESLEGAFALVWWDANSETLNFVRNDQRPLAMFQNGDKFYWASEMGMMTWLLSRNNLMPKDVQPYTFKTDIVFTIKYENRKFVFETQKVKLKEQPLNNWGYGGNYTTKKGLPANSGGNLGNKNVNVSTKFTKETGLDLHVGDEVYGYIEEVNHSYTSTTYGSDAKLHYSLVLKLACSPFLRVKLFHFPYEGEIKSDELKLLKGTIQSIVYSHQDKCWDLYMTPKSTSFVDTSCKNAEADYDQWCEEVDPQQKGESQDTKFYGFQGREITYQKFKEVMDKGCCICASPLDPVSEAMDRTCEFVDEEDAVCEDCYANKYNLRMFGYDLDNIGVNGL